MSHHIYKTEAFVVSSVDWGESNRIFSLFTPDFGLLKASAQSVRKASSKMNGHLCQLNHLEVALVRGREFWKITGAESTDLYTRASNNKENRKIIRELFGLVDRLILGEGDSSENFDEIKNVMNFISEESIDNGDRKTLLNIASLRILHHSGYIERDKEIEELISFKDWSREAFDIFHKKEDFVLSKIDNAFLHSHL